MHQYLYLADELGSKGTIAKISCRAANTALAGSGFNYSVVMSHATTKYLDFTYAGQKMHWLWEHPMVYWRIRLPASLGGRMTTPSYSGLEDHRKADKEAKGH